MSTDEIKRYSILVNNMAIGIQLNHERTMNDCLGKQCHVHDINKQEAEADKCALCPQRYRVRV